MLCPACRQAMIIVEYDDVELDMCPDCSGLWFDSQELGQLFEKEGALEQLNSLEQSLAPAPNPKNSRRCPRCRGRLRQVVVPEIGNELILDECPQGDGLWFDQGELAGLLRGVFGESNLALEKVRNHLGDMLSEDQAEDPEQRPNGPASR